MTSHFFSVGEHVIFSERRLSGEICAGEYEVREMLAVDGEEPQYQLTCADQSHHRIVGEHEIRAVTATDLMTPEAGLRLKEAPWTKRRRPVLLDPTLLA